MLPKAMTFCRGVEQRFMPPAAQELRPKADRSMEVAEASGRVLVSTSRTVLPQSLCSGCQLLQLQDINRLQSTGHHIHSGRWF
jgi:hypothetical protein